MESTSESSSGIRPDRAKVDQATIAGPASADPGPPRQAPCRDTKPKYAAQTGSASAREDVKPEEQSSRGSMAARHTTPTRCRDSPPRPSTPLDSPFRRPPALLGPFASSLQSPEVGKSPHLASGNACTKWIGNAVIVSAVDPHEIDGIFSC